ncbi:MAG: PD-(D/E)XK nuclease family protein [Candidatus Eisenbacteria bacterium]
MTLRLGPAGSGKTAAAIAALREREAAGLPALALVPEQSTFLADRQLLEPPGPVAARHARVLSFQRLALELEPASHAARRTLDRSGRRLLLRALLDRLEPRLRAPFVAVLDRPGFLETLAAVLRDLRFEGGKEARGWLGGSAAPSMSPALHRKLEALLALRDAYEAELERRGLRDPERALEVTPERIAAGAARFKDIPVEVDGFLSFTRLEAEVLEALVRAGARVSIAIACDPSLADVALAFPGMPRPEPPAFRLPRWPEAFLRAVDRPVFLAPLRTFLEISARFRAAGAAVDRVDLPAARRFRNRSLAAIERTLLAPEAGRESRAGQAAGRAEIALPIFVARDPAHEVEIWARRIDAWTRLDPDPVRPDEVAVIIRDLERYRPILETTFARFGIPVFVDRDWDLAARPLIRTILDALQVLRSRWSRESVLALLRSPLLGAAPPDVDLLDNLALEAGYDHGDWHGPDWLPRILPPRTRYFRVREDAPPDRPETKGICEGEAGTDREEIESRNVQAAQRLEEVRTRIANRVRRERLQPLRRLEESWEGGLDGAAAVATLRAWIDETGIARRLPRDPDSAREAAAVAHVLDQIASEAGERRLTIDGFADLAAAGLASLRLGRTPSRLGPVTVAEVQRSRVGEARRVIVGGLSADFPRAVGTDRFFQPRERELLSSLGLTLGPPDTLRQEEEAYFFYIAMTRATDAVLLTRPASDSEGRSIEPSPFLRELTRSCPGLVEEVPRIEEDPADLREAQTPQDLASRIGAYLALRLDKRLRGRPPEPPADSAAVRDRRVLAAYNRIVRAPRQPDLRATLAPAARVFGYANRPTVPPELLRAHERGDHLYASASRLEAFALCPYRHFAGDVLRLRPRPRAALTPIATGILAHRALELLYRARVHEQDPPERQRRLHELLERIAQEPDLAAFRTEPAGRVRLRTTGTQILRFLDVETLREQRSPFRPLEYELDFGTTEENALAIPIGGSSRLYLRGRIDRLDARPAEATKSEEDGRSAAARQEEGRPDEARPDEARPDEARPGATRPEAIVLDYKSRIAQRRGRRDDLLDGFDLQLAVYLLAAEVLGFRPAGALYVPVLPRPTLEQRAERNFGLRMTGLLPETIRAEIDGGLSVLSQPRKSSRIADGADLERLLGQARRLLGLFGRAMAAGCIDVAPAQAGSRPPCDFCDFSVLCRTDPEYNPPRSRPIDGLERFDLPLDDALDEADRREGGRA